MNGEFNAVVKNSTSEGNRLVEWLLPHYGAIGPGTTKRTAKRAVQSRDGAQRVAGRHDLDAYNTGRSLGDVLFEVTDADVVAEQEFRNVLLNESQMFKSIGGRSALQRAEAAVGYLGMKVHNLMGKRVGAPRSGGASKKSKPSGKSNSGRYPFKRKKKGHKKVKGSKSVSSKSFKSKVLRAMQQPGEYSMECTVMLPVTINCQMFHAVPQTSAASAATTAIRPFFSSADLYAAAYYLYGSPGDYDFFYISGKRTHELTNISNTEMYVRLHKVKAKVDFLNPTSFLADLYSFVTNVIYYPNNASVPNWEVEAAGLSYRTDDSGTKARVMQNDFSTPAAKKCYECKGWRVKSGKMMLMPPQQTISWITKQKEVKWNKLYHTDGVTGVGFYSNLSSFYIVEAVGQTLKGTTTSTVVASAPGNLVYACNSEYRCRTESINNPLRFIDTPYIHGVNTSTSTAFASVGQTFGPANNQPVTAV